VAELADARDLGSRGRKAVQVRFLSPAFGTEIRTANENGRAGRRVRFNILGRLL